MTSPTTEQAEPRVETDPFPSFDLPTTVLHLVPLLVIAVMAGQILLGAVRIGIANDHSTHEGRMHTWFETGWYVPLAFIDDSTNEPAAEFEDRKHTYGAGYSIVAHGFNVIIGAEQPGETNREVRAYIGRSVTIGALGLATVLAVSYALIVLTRSRTVGLWAGAVLLAIPAWTGYSMFAVKDIPAAAGWTMLTAGLTAALVPGRRLRRPMAIGALCLFGVWFSFGVRTALWVVVATSLVTFTFLVAISLERTRLLRNVVGAAVGTAGGFLAVSALHYNNAATPLRWLSSAVRTSRDFQWTGTTLTAGQLVSETPPWWYLPAWVFGSLPVMIGLLAVGGLVVTTVSVFRSSYPNGPVRGRLGRRESTVILWAHQALLLPTAATLANSTMYGGLRQHLYVLPALAALAGFAVWKLVDVSDHRRRIRIGLAAGLVLALFVPLVEQSRLYPYNFTYKNPLAGPVWERWETDLHWTSRREALSRVPEGVEAFFYLQATRTSSGGIVALPVRIARDDPALSPFIEEQGTRATEPGDADRIWVIARPSSGSPPNPGCNEHDNVTRPLRGEQVIMSYVLLCDSEIAP